MENRLRLDRTGFGDLRVWQDPDAFCYGVDAVLLADFAAEHMKGRKKTETAVCDLGTGNGIVPVLLSYMTKAGTIAGLEVQEEAFRLAEKNALENGLQERLRFVLGDVLDVPAGDLPLEKGSFDVVTSNPPYVARGSGIDNAGAQKWIARQETTGDIFDFLKAGKALLKDGGEMFLVHRPSRLVDICQAGRELSMEPKLLQLVSGRPGQAPNIMLLSMAKGGGRELRLLPDLVLRDLDGSFSKELLGIYGKNWLEH